MSEQFKHLNKLSSLLKEAKSAGQCEDPTKLKNIYEKSIKSWTKFVEISEENTEFQSSESSNENYHKCAEIIYEIFKIIASINGNFLTTQDVEFMQKWETLNQETENQLIKDDKFKQVWTAINSINNEATSNNLLDQQQGSGGDPPSDPENNSSGRDAKKGRKNSRTERINNESSESSDEGAISSESMAALKKAMQQMTKSIEPAIESARKPDREYSAIKRKPVEFPRFNGDILKYASFKSNFLRLADETKMSDTQRYMMLRSVLDDEVLSAIVGIEDIPIFQQATHFFQHHRSTERCTADGFWRQQHVHRLSQQSIRSSSQRSISRL